MLACLFLNILKAIELLEAKGSVSLFGMKYSLCCKHSFYNLENIKKSSYLISV